MSALLGLETARLKGDTDAAYLAWSKQARERPGDPMPRVFLAWLTLPSDGAWNDLKAIATMHPDNAWVHYGMARIYTVWKMRDPAEKEVAAALKSDSRFYPALVVRGDLARQRDDLDAAEKAYRAALVISDDALARTGLGLTLLAQGKGEQALPELKQAVTQAPVPDALVALIQLLRDAKSPEAATHAQTLVELRPKDAAARHTLADLRFDGGDEAGAARDYETLLRLGDVEAPVLRRLAGIYRKAADVEAESRTLQSLIALDTNDAADCVRLAELSAAGGGNEAAVGYLLEALQREPGRVDANLALGRVKLAMELPWEALEAFRAALAADATSDAARAEVTRLEAEFQLPARKPKGSLNAVFAAVSATVDKLVRERAAARAPVSGVVRARVRIGANGLAESVDILEDSVKAPAVTGHIYFGLKDATYPKKKGEPVFEFDIGHKKGK